MKKIADSWFEITKRCAIIKHTSKGTVYYVSKHASLPALTMENYNKKCSKKKYNRKIKKIARNGCSNNTWKLSNKRIGEGAFGYVVPATYFKTTKTEGNKTFEYVAKIQDFHKEEFDYKLTKNLFLNEVAILSKLNNSGVSPNLYDAWICDDIGYIIMDKLYSPPQDSLNTYKNEVVDAMKKLHSKKIFMTDFSDDNFMIDQYGNVKLIDFGLSVDYSHVKPNIKISSHYSIDYGTMTWKEAKEFDFLQIDFYLGNETEQKIAENVLGILEDQNA